MLADKFSPPMLLVYSCYEENFTKI